MFPDPNTDKYTENECDNEHSALQRPAYSFSESGSFYEWANRRQMPRHKRTDGSESFGTSSIHGNSGAHGVVPLQIQRCAGRLPWSACGANFGTM